MPEAPLLEVRGLVKTFPLDEGGQIQACKDVTITLERGETLGLVGESGSGKTTLGRCILRLLEPDGGEVIFEGRSLGDVPRGVLRGLRADMQIVFQEPVESLNPRLSVGRQIADPLRVQGKLGRADRKARVGELLQMVGLPRALADVHPGQLSAGAAQRVSIARALATNPKLLVLDEPTSALAPEEEAEVIRLLRDLQEDLGIAYIFISHNLTLVGENCHRIAIMYLSQVVEIGGQEEVYSDPRHPYTRALLSANLRPDPRQRHEVEHRWERLTGEIPSPIDLLVGCYLAGRCLYAKDRCRSEPQTLEEMPDGRQVRCWRVVEGDLTPGEIAAVRERALAEHEQEIEEYVEVLQEETHHEEEGG